MIEAEKNMIRDLATKGCNDCQIAEIMTYDRTYICDIRRELGIKVKRGRPCIVPRETVAEMRRMRHQGMSYQRIGERLHISRYTVYDCIKRGEKNSNSKQKH